MTAFSPHIIVLSAPSGAGKSSLIRALSKNHTLHYSISYTTRAPRENETHGQDYYFVDDDEFNYLSKGGAFVETTRIHGNAYGTPWKNFIQKESAQQTESWTILDIDIPGFLALKERIPNMLSIFILPPSIEALRARIEQRQPDITPLELHTRLAKASEEIVSAPLYDYTILNDDFDRALGELNFIISCEKLKNVRRKNYVSSLLENLKKTTN